MPPDQRGYQLPFRRHEPLEAWQPHLQSARFSHRQGPDDELVHVPDSGWPKSRGDEKLASQCRVDERLERAGQGLIDKCVAICRQVVLEVVQDEQDSMTAENVF